MNHEPPSVKVERPWGKFEQYTHNRPCTVKVITVAPGGTVSRQYHEKRDELWVVLDPGACVELDGAILYPEPEEKLFIPRETVHRLSAPAGGDPEDTGDLLRSLRRGRHRWPGRRLRPHKTRP